jgi:hypothetical protein
VTTDAPLTLALRIPGWCPPAEVRVDGAPVDAVGYAGVRRDWSAGATVTLELPMPARVVRPHPRIDAVRGCVALARGPLVYCLEQADLPDGVTLEDVRVDAAAPVTTGRRPDIPVTLVTDGMVEPPASDVLYPAGAAESRGDPLALTAVPYFLWGNRTPGPMRVWIPVTTT